MGIKILLIDDEQEILEQCKLLWEKKGEDTTVITTTNPLEGLEEIKKDDFDAIVSDYKMPEMNGLELLKKVRERGLDTTFIILTGKGNEEVAKEALNWKADKYIKKGTSPTKQYETIVNTIFEKPVS